MAGLNWVKWPLTINLGPTSANVDGVELNYMTVAEFISQLIHPDPRKWYRFERKNNRIIVHVRITEDEPNGSPIASTGPSTEDSGGQGQETPHP